MPPVPVAAAPTVSPVLPVTPPTVAVILNGPPAVVALNRPVASTVPPPLAVHAVAVAGPPS